MLNPEELPENLILKWNNIYLKLETWFSKNDRKSLFSLKVHRVTNIYPIILFFHFRYIKMTASVFSDDAVLMAKISEGFAFEKPLE